MELGPSLAGHVWSATHRPMFWVLAMGHVLLPVGVGVGKAKPREHINRISSYVDVSMVYGSDVADAQALRTFKDGKLLVCEGVRLEGVGRGDASAPPVGARSLFLSSKTAC